MPVGIIRKNTNSEKATSGYKLGVWQSNPSFARDPRFDRTSGHLNEGLFAKSYDFVKDYQAERFDTLKQKLKEAKKDGDPDLINQIKTMLQEERDFASKLK